MAVLRSSNRSALGLLLVAMIQNIHTSDAFTTAPRVSRTLPNQRFAGTTVPRAPLVVYSAEGEPQTEEEKKEAVGNLVENDEWEGLTMELSEVIKTAVVEDIKKKTKDFIGKDDYQVGDITKEIDNKVKKEIASMRGNEEYQLGDLVVVMDQMVSVSEMRESLFYLVFIFVSLFQTCFLTLLAQTGQRHDGRNDWKAIRGG